MVLVPHSGNTGGGGRTAHTRGVCPRRQVGKVGTLNEGKYTSGDTHAHGDANTDLLLYEAHSEEDFPREEGEADVHETREGCIISKHYCQRHQYAGVGVNSTNNYLVLTGNGDAKVDVNPRIPAHTRNDGRPSLFNRRAADPEKGGAEAKENVNEYDSDPQKHFDPAVSDAQEHHSERDLAPRRGDDGEGHRDKIDAGEQYDGIRR